MDEIQQRQRDRRKVTPSRPSQTPGRGVLRGRGLPGLREVRGGGSNSTDRQGRGGRDKRTIQQTKSPPQASGPPTSALPLISETSTTDSSSSTVPAPGPTGMDLSMDFDNENSPNISNQNNNNDSQVSTPASDTTSENQPRPEFPAPPDTTNVTGSQSTPPDTQPQSNLRSTPRYTSSGTPSEPIQTNLAAEIVNKTRYTLNFKLTSDQRGTVGLSSFYTEFFREMQEYCADINILVWNEEINKGTIKTPEKNPTTITQIKKYFSGARTHDAGGPVYSKIHLSFPITVDRPTFENDFSSCCRDKKINFYKTTVQHHNVKTVCWLSYLTSCTNTLLLSRMITDSFRSTTGKSVPIGCTYRFLNNQRYAPEGEKLKAIHVECPTDKEVVVKKFLRSCSAQKVYPGGARFRVMNEFWPYMTPENQEK